MPRNWTNIKIQAERINEMRRRGKTRREIGEELGLSVKQIENWVSRNNKQEAAKERSHPKVRGRKPAVTLTEYKYENKRLKMENELLRDFLRLSGRR